MSFTHFYFYVLPPWPIPPWPIPSLAERSAVHRHRDAASRRFRGVDAPLREAKRSTSCCVARLIFLIFGVGERYCLPVVPESSLFSPFVFTGYVFPFYFQPTLNVVVARPVPHTSHLQGSFGLKMSRPGTRLLVDASSTRTKASGCVSSSCRFSASCLAWSSARAASSFWSIAWRCISISCAIRSCTGGCGV